MYASAGGAGADYSSGTMVDKDAGQDTTLGSAYSPVDYMSITSFPRLPEDDVISGENTIRSRKDDDNVLSEQDTEPEFLRSARLQRLASSASETASRDASPLRETTRDPLTRDCSCPQDCSCPHDGLTVIITACLTFATGVTVALIVQIYFGDPQIFKQGAVVTDAVRCTSLGLDVLRKQGSSVDAAVAAALCLGVVHPHSSGIGGGGVMLVHDIRKNKSRIIDFRETAPSGLREEMLLTQELRTGMLVAVPGMLKGLQQAHKLYGRMPWKEVVALAAGVARNGFNITHDLADALSKVKDQNVSGAFRDLFLPDGQPPLPGLFTTRPDLAAILDTVATNGISVFYSGNLTQEMTSTVQASGGVLTEEDFINYTTVLEQPLQSLYQGHQVLSAPPPHAGVALLTTLNILEGYNITSQMQKNSTHHWMAESLKIALSLTSGLGDPVFNSSVSEVVAQMLSKTQAGVLRHTISNTQASAPGQYTPSTPPVHPPYTLQDKTVASQVLVMGTDDFIVSVMSSLNQPFGSRIVTPSGIVLNSQILDFSWPNNTRSSLTPNQHNRIQPGKRPLSFLMPMAVRPSVGLCGTYVALGSSNGDRALSGIAQVLLNVLSLHKNLSASVGSGRLHPQLQHNVLLVDAEFPKADVDALLQKGHDVERVDVISLVEGTRRTNDLIVGVKDPRSTDASALTMSKSLP